MPRRSLEEIAERCVPGEGPVDIHALSSGLVNESCRVSRAGRCYSLRVAADNTGAHFGIDRIWECRVLACAAAAGVAPIIHCCEPAEGILVADWVTGRPWTAAQAQHPGNIDAMAALLRRVHGLSTPLPARVMNPAAWVAYYSAMLARRDSAGLAGACDAWLAQLAARREPPPVLCHGDLHRLNVAIGERVLLLDWEYAHVSDPYWDLAGWIANNDGTEQFAADLLASYLQRPAAAHETARLRPLVWLYDYICLLWSELYVERRSGAGCDSVAARAGQLSARLRSASGSRAR